MTNLWEKRGSKASDVFSCYLYYIMGLINMISIDINLINSEGKHYSHQVCPDLKKCTLEHIQPPHPSFVKCQWLANERLNAVVAVKRRVEPQDGQGCWDAGGPKWSKTTLGTPMRPKEMQETKTMTAWDHDNDSDASPSKKPPEKHGPFFPS